MHERDRAQFLVIEDDAAFVRALRRILDAWGDTTVVSKLVPPPGADVLERAWDAILADVKLPDGSGLDLLQRVLERSPATRALVITGYATPEVVGKVRELEADLAVKPVSTLLVDGFLRAALPLPKRLAAAVDEWARRYRLTDAERDILLRAAEGMSSGELAQMRSASPLTIRTQCRDLLRKTGQRSVRDALMSLMQRVASPEPSDTFAPTASRGSPSDSRLLVKAREVASRHGLTEKEIDLVLSVMRGLSRKEYVVLRGLSPNTCKKRAQSAVRKLGVLSLAEVRDAVLGEVTGNASDRS